MQRQSLADIAYVTIRRRLTRGEWEPDTVLRENELAQALDMSRTPVREALRRLQADGFLQAHRSGGLVMPDRGTDELIDDYRIRAELEGLAASLLATTISSDEIAKLERLTDQSFRELEEDVYDNYADLNQQFHRRLVAATGRRRLIDFHGILSDSIMMVSRREIAITDKAGLISALYQHRDLTRALRDRDPDTARQVIRAHVLSGVQWLQDTQRATRRTEAGDGDEPARAGGQQPVRPG